MTSPGATMSKDKFEFARIASPEEIAEYLTALAGGLKRGEVSLEDGDGGLRLSPSAEIKLEIKVKQKTSKGRLELELSWKRDSGPRAATLSVSTAARPTPG